MDFRYVPLQCSVVRFSKCSIPARLSAFKLLFFNVSGRTHTIQEGAKVGHLIVIPVVIADFVSRLGEERGTGGFGSTGE